jgi:hypothetical protein
MYSIKPVIDGKKTEILYRDLNLQELGFLRNIKNYAVQAELAAQVSITNFNPKDIPWPIRQKIGGEVLTKSLDCVTDLELKDITISEFRANDIETDPFLPDIVMILKHFPGQSLTELLKLTHRDIIELVVICEKISSTKIYGSGAPSSSKSHHLVNPKDLPDGGKSLQREIEKLNSRGIPR